MARSFEDRLDSFAEAWRPKPGDKLIGTVVELDVRDGGYGQYPIVTVETDEGEEVAIHAFHTVLARELAERQPAVGERIGVKYLGKHPEREYHNYKVVRDETPRQVDWDKIRDEAEAGAPGLEDDDDRSEARGQDDDIPF